VVGLLALHLFKLLVFVSEEVIVLVVSENLPQLLFVDSVELVIASYKSA